MVLSMARVGRITDAHSRVWFWFVYYPVSGLMNNINHVLMAHVVCLIVHSVFYLVWLYHATSIIFCSEQTEL